MGSLCVLAGILGPEPLWANDSPGAASRSLDEVVVERLRVHLHIPVAAVGDPRAAELADHLDGVARQMLEHLRSSSLPGTSNTGPKMSPEHSREEALRAPLEVIVEDSFEDQGRRLETLAPALVADGRLHIVFHREDLPFYEHGLARLILARAGLVAPLWLEHGAALWLADAAAETPWYGRRWRDWIGDLSFAAALPTADELLVDEAQGSDSAVLFPAAAAGLVDLLPGASLEAKLNPNGLAARVRARWVRLGAQSFAMRSKAEASPSHLSELPFQRGVSLAMANGLEVGYHARGIDTQLERLSALGVDAASIMPFAYQRNPNKPGLVFLNRHPGSETDAGAVHAARRCREKGLRVLWKPHIWVSHQSWPGDIAMANEPDWKAWWRLYGRYVLHHAVLARHAKAELFSVGVELGRTVSREAEWRHLIASVRRLYPGRVTYAGNWWGDYDKVPFWDALDYVGVDAYFPLAGESEADRATLRAGARQAVDQLRQAAERFGRPVLLTEMGFSARKGAWVSPHEEGGEFSPLHQSKAYDVWLEALGQPEWLAGIYVWKVFSHPRAEGGTRPDFRFLGRPAEEVVRRYFEGAGE